MVPLSVVKHIILISGGPVDDKTWGKHRQAVIINNKLKTLGDVLLPMDMSSTYFAIEVYVYLISLLMLQLRLV